MIPNIHIHLVTSDLDRSSAFYEALFGPPVKAKPGYRKFLPSFAPLNLALSAAATGSRGAVSTHLGVQFETSEEVRQQLTRIKATGLSLREEIGVSCCHANQDKFWVRDPDGVEWEFYAINFDIEGPVPREDVNPCCVSERESRAHAPDCGA
jgi:catechol 2,3-dioxygenase-like lactoylglutathione lyase family enzyme